MGRVETKGVRRRYFPQVHTNSRNLWACDNTFKHFCYFHRNIWCWCSNVMLPQQSCPSARSTWQVLGYQKEGGKKKKPSSLRTVFDICHDRNTVRGEKKKRSWGQGRGRGKRRSCDRCEKLYVWKKKINLAFSRFGAIFIFFLFTVRRTKRGFSYCHTVESSGLRTKWFTKKRNLLHWRQQFSRAPLWGNSFCVFLLKSALSAPKSSDRGPPRALVFTSKS